MRGLIEELRGALTWFAQEQREYFSLVVSCDDTDVSVVQTAIYGFDQGQDDAVYLTFAHEAKTERAYVDVMLELMSTRREITNALRQEQGLAPVPPPPVECVDGSRQPAERIKSIVRWWRDSLANREQRIVLSLLPTQLPRPEVYRQIVWGLLPFGALEPWTRHTRLIVRDGRTSPFIEPLLRQTPSEATVAYTVDFSPQACEEGLAADAANTALSPRERGVAMLQLAALDYAHQHLPAALEKYGHLANLFHDMGEKALAAVCVCGAGDVHWRAEQLPKAKAALLTHPWVT
jgi:hypothetical protein